VRLIKSPDEQVHGLDWRQYKIGHVYDLPHAIADYLVVAGFAVVEMRSQDRGIRIPRLRSGNPRKS
jgi:hypothetical protein